MEDHIRGVIKRRFEAYMEVSELMERYYNFEITLSRCKACPGFAGTWACPGFSFDPRTFWAKYSRLHLIVDQLSNRDLSTVEQAQEQLTAQKHLFDQEMLDLEKQMKGGYALAAQECMECKKCARLSGLPCLHPDRMRFALEALGILVVQLVPDQLGFPVLWSDGVSIPDYYILAGGVLEG